MAGIDFTQLIYKNKLISDQVDAKELAIVLCELEKSLDGKGAIVEFGCYMGTTSLYIRRVLDIYNDSREFHVYDSFAGLPEKTKNDDSALGIQFCEGELMASKNQFILEFKKASLKTPIIHKGWFDQIDESEVPSLISFAFLDGDYYESVKSSLKLIESKLLPGATIIIDDYMNESLPGAARAADEWSRKKGYSIRRHCSLAIIYCS